MRPHHDFRAAVIEVARERLERAGHVLVAQIPRFVPAAKYGAIVALGAGDDPRVLLRVKELVRGFLAVARGEAAVFTAQIDKLRHDFVLAVLTPATRGGITVVLGVFAEGLETCVTLTGALRGGGIGLIEVTKHRFHRGVEAVEVHAEDPGRLTRSTIVIAEPFEKAGRYRVAPHPGGKAPEVAERGIRVGIIGITHRIAMRAQHVRPVRL